MADNERFRTGLSTAQSISKAIPLGTLLIIMFSWGFFLINIFSGGKTTPALCIASNTAMSGMPWQILNLFTYQLVSVNFWHQLVGIIFFPLVASNFEAKVGTFQFLHIFFMGGGLIGSIYVLLVWLISFAIPSWGTACISGLDIPIFLFLTTESLNERGLYELTTNLGLKVANFLYPFIYVVLFFVLMPLTSWISHLLAIGLGFLRTLDLI
jgi:membrane associated rhomboid family serine protease